MQLQDLEGYELAGRFKLKRLIGEGGYGAVFEAEQISVGRRCAVKVLLPEQATHDATVQRFRVEARATSRLTHANSVVLYDFGKVEDLNLLFLAMEYLEGQDLNKIITTEGPLDLASTVHITRQVGASLNEAHQIGLIHRDMKPHNIMVLNRGSDRFFVKVIDFGIAKVVESSRLTLHELTQAGTIIGTPHYMAPEQILYREMDGRVDQYALAATVYKMLTGRTPFQADSAMEMAHKHLNERPLPLTILRPELEVPPAFEDVLLRALSKDMNDRYPTILSFATALSDAAQMEAPVPEETRPTRRSRRQVHETERPTLMLGDLESEPGLTPPMTATPQPGPVDSTGPGVPGFDLASMSSGAVVAEVSAQPVDVASLYDGPPDAKVAPISRRYAPLELEQETGGAVREADSSGFDELPDIFGGFERDEAEPRTKMVTVSELSGAPPELGADDGRVMESQTGAAVGPVGQTPTGPGRKMTMMVAAALVVVALVGAILVLKLVNTSGPDVAMANAVVDPNVALVGELPPYEPQPEVVSVAVGIAARDLEASRVEAVQGVAKTMALAADDDPPAVATRQEIPVPKDPEPVREEAVEEGRVRVTIIPWGTLYVGRKRYADNPRQEVKLPAGRHTLVLKQNNEVKDRKTVDVRAGSLTMVRLVAK